MPRKIDKIIVHCSASPDARDIGLVEINQWHRERGFDGVLVENVRIYCGYHAIIRRYGEIEFGRPEQEVGAHVQGHNLTSLGICWVGTNQITEKQYQSLLGMIRMWMLKYNIETKAVMGHTEINKAKTCPNLNMEKLRDELAFQMGGLQ